MIGGKKQVKCPVPITRTSVSWGSTSKRSGNANNSHVCPRTNAKARGQTAILIPSLAFSSRSANRRCGRAFVYTGLQVDGPPFVW
jgi:hypothetical protein